MTTGRIPSVDGGIQPTIIDAAGDLIYGASNDTPARLGIGTAGQVLAVNSGATAPEWVTAATIPITTEGDLIIGDATGDPVRLPIGAAGTVLTSDGTTASYAAVGGLTQIASTTLSGSSTSVSSIPATFKTLFVVINAVSTSTNAQIEFIVNNTTSEYAYTGTTRIGSTSAFTGNDGDSRIRLSLSQNLNANATVSAYTLSFYNYAETNCRKLYNLIGSTNGQVDNLFVNLGGSWNNNAAINQVTITTTAGTFDNGTIEVYGVA